MKIENCSCQTDGQGAICGLKQWRGFAPAANDFHIVHSIQSGHILRSQNGNLLKLTKASLSAPSAYDGICSLKTAAQQRQHTTVYYESR